MALNIKADDLEENARIHQIGHLFGLAQGDGGVMSIYYPRGENRPGVYGSPAEWPDTWCGKIAQHMGK